MIRERAGGEGADTWTPQGTRLCLLGTWSLSATPDRPMGVVSRDARRLLALVALRGPTPREEIRAMLWPDAAETSAARLRNALWRLSKTRQTLLEERSGSIALAPGVGLDVDEMFRVAAAVDAGLVGGGAHRFAADLLPGWDEDWLVVDRERIRQARLHALERMSQTLRDEGNHAAALDAALVALHADPLRESAHRAVISVHLAEGNYGEAVRQYERCCAVLSSELGVAPSRALTALLSTGGALSSQG